MDFRLRLMPVAIAATLGLLGVKLGNVWFALETPVAAARAEQATELPPKAAAAAPEATPAADTPSTPKPVAAKPAAAVNNPPPAAAGGGDSLEDLIRKAVAAPAKK